MAKTNKLLKVGNGGKKTRGMVLHGLVPAHTKSKKLQQYEIIGEESSEKE